MQSEGHETQASMRYTTLDVFSHERPSNVWTLRSKLRWKLIKDSRKNPSLKTCLGLGAGLPEKCSDRARF